MLKLLAASTSFHPGSLFSLHESLHGLNINLEASRKFMTSEDDLTVCIESLRCCTGKPYKPKDKSISIPVGWQSWRASRSFLQGIKAEARIYYLVRGNESVIIGLERPSKQDHNSKAHDKFLKPIFADLAGKLPEVSVQQVGKSEVIAPSPSVSVEVQDQPEKPPYSWDEFLREGVDGEIFGEPGGYYLRLAIDKPNEKIATKESEWNKILGVLWEKYNDPELVASKKQLAVLFVNSWKLTKGFLETIGANTKTLFELGAQHQPLTSNSKTNTPQINLDALVARSTVAIRGGEIFKIRNFLNELAAVKWNNQNEGQLDTPIVAAVEVDNLVVLKMIFGMLKSAGKNKASLIVKAAIFYKKPEIFIHFLGAQNFEKCVGWIMNCHRSKPETVEVWLASIQKLKTPVPIEDALNELVSANSVEKDFLQFLLYVGLEKSSGLELCQKYAVAAIKKVCIDLLKGVTSPGMDVEEKASTLHFIKELCNSRRAALIFLEDVSLFLGLLKASIPLLSVEYDQIPAVGAIGTFCQHTEAVSIILKDTALEQTLIEELQPLLTSEFRYCRTHAEKALRTLRAPR
jgi:hypothetical protein